MRRALFWMVLCCLSIPGLTRAQLAGPVQIVPVVARLNGGAGSYWQSDVSITNLGSLDATVTAAFLQEEQPNDPDHVPTYDVAVPAGETLQFGDVLGKWFPQVGSTKGALVLLGNAADGSDATVPLAVSSRTYNAADPAKTYGQGVPAISPVGEGGQTWEAVFGRGKAVLPGIQQNDRFRTNIGVLNLSQMAIQVRVTVLDADGRTLTEKSEPVEALSLSQWSLSKGLGVASLPAGGRVDVDLDPAAITWDPCTTDSAFLSTTAGVFVAYSTTMDGATNDSEFHLGSTDWSVQADLCGHPPYTCLK